MLRTYISDNQLDWEEYLAACVFCYNTTIRSSANESPFFLMYGRDPIVSIDLIIKHKTVQHFAPDDETAVYRESLISALHSAWSAAAYNSKRSAAYKKQYDKSGLQQLSVRVGYRVLLRNFSLPEGLSTKLCYPWPGQFRVIGIDHPHLTIVSISSPQ